MAEPFLSEIRIMANTYPPKGWAFCNGQTLAINQNQALFSLLGTSYGGNGQTTFNLPDLRSRVPLHMNVPNEIGTLGGAESVAVSPGGLPSHSHTLMASSAASNTVSAVGMALAAPARRTLYDSTADTTMGIQSIATAGGNQGHENRQPYLTVNFMIALVGIFPSRF